MIELFPDPHWPVIAMVRGGSVFRFWMKCDRPIATSVDLSASAITGTERPIEAAVSAIDSLLRRRVGGFRPATEDARTKTRTK